MLAEAAESAVALTDPVPIRDRRSGHCILTARRPKLR
jgi:hypothetical protein